MKTVIRIFQDQDGVFEAQNLTNCLCKEDKVQVLGMIELIKKSMLDGFVVDLMSDDDVDDVRRLLDE